MSRPTTSTRLLEIQGTFRKNRHAARAGEVEPAAGFPGPPEWLTAEALVEWKRLGADSAYSEAICTIDRSLLAVYCTLWARFVEGENIGKPVKAAHVAAMVNIGAKFGLNPADRSKLKARGAAPTVNPWERLKNSGKNDHAK